MKSILAITAALALTSRAFEPDYDHIKKSRAKHNEEMKPYREARKKKNITRR